MLPLPLQDEVPAISLTGHQWWWEVQYNGGRMAARSMVPMSFMFPPGARSISTSESADVIHGFWIPRLGGKIDAIPGRTNVMRVFAEEPGIYRGQCAEFCGAQHARMGLVHDCP